MTRAVALILSLLLAASFPLTDGRTTVGLTGPNCNGSVFDTPETNAQSVVTMAYGNDLSHDSTVEPAVENSEGMVSDTAPQTSRTGRLIMTILLITLVLIGLSIMPIILISHAARIRRQQEKKSDDEKPSA